MSHLAALKGIDSPRSKSDHYFTPPDLLALLHGELRFTLDVASHPSAPSTEIIPRSYLFPGQDGLKLPWAGERIWCNPPYSNISPWVSRAWEVASICPLIAMLLPANKTEQPWWQQGVEPFRDRRSTPGQHFAVETRFLGRRIRFGDPEDPRGERASSGTFGSVLVIWRAL